MSIKMTLSNSRPLLEWMVVTVTLESWQPLYSVMFLSAARKSGMVEYFSATIFKMLIRRLINRSEAPASIFFVSQLLQ